MAKKRSSTRQERSLFDGLSSSPAGEAEPAPKKKKEKGSSPALPEKGPGKGRGSSASPREGRAGKGGNRANAEDLAKRQREISVSEFFTKNRHLLGFDNPRKALLTAVKEGVDNALDACEEAGILPEIYIQIRAVPGRDDRFVVVVEDNGPGIVKSQVPAIFAKLLYGSKFHSLRQTRGQQGIGISAAGMYGQLTTGHPTKILTRTSPKAQAWYFELRVDTVRNRPEKLVEEPREWDKPHGTRVEIEMEARFQRGQRSVDDYLRQTAIANPHAAFLYEAPDGVVVRFHRATEELPPLPQEIKPHPYGVELGLLIRLLKATKARWMTGFLQSDFCRVGPKVAEQILAKAKISPKANPRRMGRAEADRLYRAINATKISAPPTSCIVPIGEELILEGLRKEVEADFYAAATRPPSVYRGNPFQVEVGLAFGKPGATMEVDEKGRIVPVGNGKKTKKKAAGADAELLGAADEPIKLLRFANRVPLLYQQSACAISKTVIQLSWKNYGLQHPRGALPLGPMVLLVHLASVWVPFTSESKEAIASYPEILKEIKLALQEVGRKLGAHIRKGRRIAEEYKKRTFIEKYIPHIGIALQEILGLPDKKRDRIVEDLRGILERSRKL
ncbi:MAG TPA: DNA topoisomerase VI subunit B [Planctomycetes bacterium]|nr:DNA topoisomerase VI subunit B [Planctomycetota bacterium]